MMNSTKRILICGGRNFDNYTLLSKVMRKIRNKHPTVELVHGAAKGADTLAQKYADEHDIITKIYPADWEKYGKKAGPIRNAAMLFDSQPDAVIAFPGGNGTAHMIKTAQDAGFTVMIIKLTECKQKLGERE